MKSRKNFTFGSRAEYRVKYAQSLTLVSSPSGIPQTAAGGNDPLLARCTINNPPPATAYRSFHGISFFKHLAVIRFIIRPGDLTFLPFLQHALFGCSLYQVVVTNITDLFKKICKVISLGESCKLRLIVKPNVDNSFYVIFINIPKKVFASFFVNPIV